MSDVTFGYLILVAGIVFVIGLVFAAAQRVAPPRATPPPGVHVPPGSWLPITFALGAALIGAALVFRPHVPPPGQPVNLFLLVPGVVVFVSAAVGWVRAAGREWHETESGSHDDPGH